MPDAKRPDDDPRRDLARLHPEERIERIGGGEVSLDRLAHELRTPLAAIQSMAEAIADGYLGSLGNERHADYVRSIAETARHALAVVDTMLVRSALTGSETTQVPAVLDLGAIARDVAAAMMVLAARSGVRLRLADGVSPAAAMARPTDIRQMLINLVSNGLTHAGGGATVSIRTGTGAGVAWIEVEDDGAGMPGNIVAKLEAGQPLHDDAEACPDGRIRLGLTLTRALAEVNGGRLELQSGPNGTLARLVLPSGA